MYVCMYIKSATLHYRCLSELQTNTYATNPPLTHTYLHVQHAASARRRASAQQRSACVIRQRASAYLNVRHAASARRRASAQLAGEREPLATRLGDLR